MTKRIKATDLRGGDTLVLPDGREVQVSATENSIGADGMTINVVKATTLDMSQPEGLRLTVYGFKPTQYVGVRRDA